MDLGDVAAGAHDAAQRASIIVDVPIAIEMRLNLGSHADGAVLVTGGERRAEGSQLGDGAEFTGLLVPTTLLGAAAQTLDKVDGDAVHGGLLRVGKHEAHRSEGVLPSGARAGLSSRRAIETTSSVACSARTSRLFRARLCASGRRRDRSCHNARRCA